MDPVMSHTLARLSPEDLRQVIHLFRSRARSHQHLDWYTLETWLEDPSLCCWTAQRNGMVEALLGATLSDSGSQSDSNNIAWLRFAIPANQFGYDPASGPQRSSMGRGRKSGGFCTQARPARKQTGIGRALWRGNWKS